jgi:hypothetical protein
MIQRWRSPWFGGGERREVEVEISIQDLVA